jgi:ATP-dependent Lon protease
MLADGRSPVSQANPDAGRPNELLPVLPLRDVCLFPGASLGVAVSWLPHIRAREVAARLGNRILAVGQKDGSVDRPLPQDLQGVGTIALITDQSPVESGGFHLELDGLTRARLVTVFGVDTMIAEAQVLDEGDPELEWGPAVEALARYMHTHQELRTFLDKQRRSPDPMAWVNLACQHLAITTSARQKLLDADARERCSKISRGLDALLRKEQSG